MLKQVLGFKKIFKMLQFWSSCCGTMGLLVSLQLQDVGLIPRQTWYVKGSGVSAVA